MASVTLQDPTSEERDNLLCYGDYLILTVKGRGIVTSSLFGDSIPARVSVAPLDATIDNIKVAVFKIQPRSRSEAAARYRAAVEELALIRKARHEKMINREQLKGNAARPDTRKSHAQPRPPARVKSGKDAYVAPLDGEDGFDVVTSDDLDPNDVDADLLQQVALLEELKDKEAEENINEKNRRLGHPVCYGDVFQFRHSHTQRMLAISSARTSETDLSNVAVDLVFKESVTEACWLRFVPWTPHLNGGPITVRDSVMIQSACKATEAYFLHKSSKELPISSPDHGQRELSFSSKTEHRRTLFFGNYFSEGGD